MTSQSSPMHSSPGENNEDDPTALSESHYHTQEDVSTAENHEDTPVSGSQQAKQPPPMQKRRRVTRACDECRRKKIKCDGKQPCTHCTVYSYECTYDQPSNRRRNPAPQYIEALENRLHKAEAVLRVLAPDLNLDDPRLDPTNPEQFLATLRRDKPQESLASKPATGSSQPESSAEGGDESLLETMMENSGSLDLDDQGHWDYHGHSSGIIFMQRLRKQFGNMVIPLRPSPRSRPISHVLESPKSQSESPQDSHSNSNSTLPPTHDLPSKEVARTLCRNTFDHACVLMRFVHEPSFFAMFDRIYDTPWEQFTNEEHTFLPLLYVVIAVGCLFSDDVESTLDVEGYEGAIGQGFQYFRAGRHLLDITDCRDLTSLQAICFMVLFLQSSAKLSTCYSYVGIAQRAALRLGLHRSVTANFNPIERELRKRIFWVIRKMDVYVSTLLGLPQMVNDEDIDQEYPLEIDDEFITPAGILPMPPDRISLMAGANAHARLVDIIVKVVKYIYPVKNAKHRSKGDHTYMVSHSKIREIERDLQAWMEALPPALRHGDEVSTEMERMRQLLRISYAHVQMSMYRPFLHYVSNGFQAQGIDKRSYACAAACVSVARNVVHITAGMYKKGLLNGSYWFTMYTTYFAILSLVFFVLENPDSPSAKDSVLKDALEGKNTLNGLAKKSMAADRCAQSLNSLFKHLPEKLRSRQSSSAQPVSLKRPTPSSSVSKPKPQRTPSTGSQFSLPQRANTFPAQLASMQSRTTAESANTSAAVDDSWTFDPRSFVSKETSTGMSREPLSSPSPAFVSDQVNQSSGSSLTASPAQNLPDLMPIMFPSGDPFAYPTQPMSTLEDGHFKNERSGPSAQFNTTTQGGTASSASGNAALRSSTPGVDTFANLRGFPNGTTGRIPTTLPPHFQHLGLQSQVQSPASHSSTPGSNEMVQSPDLVSLPNQNFMWQGLGFAAQNMMADQAPSQQQQQQTSGTNDVRFDGMNGFSPMGMAMDMNVNFDEVFGNVGMNSGNGYPGNDDWSQWMNVGV
ncbi:hypothetical protein VTN77DRAFT_5828 [Rasamsonia byssochlamydoides]|uniref:uncharacterized protein n=1 Tax=Rasamsonia byssochlamydoides TaxID=89139 RepID=UPI00374325D3